MPEILAAPLRPRAATEKVGIKKTLTLGEAFSREDPILPILTTSVSASETKWTAPGLLKSDLEYTREFQMPGWDRNITPFMSVLHILQSITHHTIYTCRYTGITHILHKSMLCNTQAKKLSRNKTKK